MCNPALAVAALSAYSAYNQSKAAKQQAEYNSVIASNNAKMAEYQAVDAAQRGEQEAMAVRRKGAALKADQRTTMAARGLSLDAGTAQSLLDQTDYFNESDIATVRTNAGKESFAKRSQARNFQIESQMYKAAGDAQNPLLSAAVSGATTYAMTSMLGKGDAPGVSDKWTFGKSGSTIGSSSTTSDFSWATGGRT